MNRTKAPERTAHSIRALQPDRPSPDQAVPHVEPQWQRPLQQLLSAAERAVPGPPWWNEDLRFFGALESHAPKSQYAWDGMRRLATQPFVLFQFTLAGWGRFEHEDGPPQSMNPGMGFFAVVPSRHRYYLPKDSPGWTFGWINIFHRYLVERISRRIALGGAVVRFEPSSPFLASALRIISGCWTKDFRDPFDVELAVFEFVVAYERELTQSMDSVHEGDRLLEAVRKWVLADPRRELNVETLAAEYGMSRSHFSHYFRARTGQTPARVVAQTRIQEATRMLMHGQASLKQISDVCGFANENHFSRVFRRFQHISPGAYRKLMP